MAAGETAVNVAANTHENSQCALLRIKYQRINPLQYDVTGGSSRPFTINDRAFRFRFTHANMRFAAFMLDVTSLFDSVLLSQGVTPGGIGNFSQGTSGPIQSDSQGSPRSRSYIESTTPFPIAFRLTCVVLAAKSGRNFSGPNMLSSSTTFALAGRDQEARHAIFGIETTVAVVVRARGRLHGCGSWIRFGDHRRDAGQSHVAERGLGLRYDECCTLRRKNIQRAVLRGYGRHDGR
jgi:hypothetical protein